MPREILRQSNWNGGELDPAMLARRDLKSYYSSAAVIENLTGLPQGPLVRRAGTTFVDRVRGRLEAVTLEAGMLAAPEGGTAADAATANGTLLETTTALEVVDPYVILTIDFGAPVAVDAVDVIDYGVGPAGVGAGGGPIEPPFEYPWGPDGLAVIE